MPKKIKDIEEQEEAFEWDKTRIAIAIGVLILLIVGGVFAKKYFLGANQESAQKTVQGVSTQDSSSGSTSSGNNSVSSSNLNFSLPTVSDLQLQLNQLEQKIQHLSIQDVASASPQVQDIIQQVQNLPNLPKDQAKSVCQQVCGNYMK